VGADVAQCLGLLRRLDTLGHQQGIGSFGEAAKKLDQTTLLGLVVDPAHDGHVHLDVAGLKLRQHTQRRVARTEVVHRHRKAHLRDRFDRLFPRVEALEAAPLGDLKDDSLGPRRERLQARSQARRVGELIGVKVHEQANMVGQLMHPALDAVHHDLRNLRQHAVLLSGSKHRHRTVEGGMPAAQESLVGVHAAVGGMEDGLQRNLDVFAGQALFQHPALFCAGGLLLHLHHVFHDLACADDFVDRFDQSTGLEGFFDDAGDLPPVHRADHHWEVELPGDQHPQTAWLELSQSLQDLHAIEDREVVVHQSHIKALLGGVTQPLGAMSRLDDFVSLARQDASDAPANQGVVFDCENSCHGGTSDEVQPTCRGAARSPFPQDIGKDTGPLEVWMTDSHGIVTERTLSRRPAGLGCARIGTGAKWERDRVHGNPDVRSVPADLGAQMRILIADKLAEFVPKALEASGCAVTVNPSLKNDSLEAALQDINPEVVVVRSTKIGTHHIAAAPNLSLIIRAGAGTNTIDVAQASSRGIFVSNCPGRNAIAVAELTFGHLINLDRRIVDNVVALRDGRWEKKKLGRARGLHGRTLALLGLGQIGREVIVRARAFGIRVRAWSRSLTQAQADALGVELAGTPLDACRGAHMLSIHLAKTPETTHLVGLQLLEALQPGAYVVHTARGGIVDEEALQKAIRTRGLRAGLDVFEREPGSADPTFDDPIAHNPSVYGTHHIGASTDQATESVGTEVVRIVETYQRTGGAPNCVNLATQSRASHLLVVRHADRVGVLASVLEALREDDVNVQEMENVVFRGEGSAAVARIQVNSPPSPLTVDRIQDSPYILSTSLVSMER